MGSRGGVGCAVPSPVYRKAVNMRNFVFENKTKIIFGRDSVMEIGKEIVPYSRQVLIVHAGEPFLQPLLETVVLSLEQQGIAYLELSGVKPNPEISTVYDGIALCRQKNVGFVLAVGGGSVIDTAKTIAAGVHFDGDIWMAFEHEAQIGDVMPLGTIVTIAATGSESSNGAVITNPKKNLKLDIVDTRLRPTVSIIDPSLTCTLPAWHTFCGIADIMSHTMERYFTSVQNTELTDRLAEGLLKTCINNARKLLADPADYDARAEISWASTLSHNDLMGTGREGDWCCHWIGMGLSAYYNTTHGATISIVTPAWMKYTIEKGAARFAQFAIRVFDVPQCDDPLRTAEIGIAKLEDFYREIGVPIRLQEVGIMDDRHFEDIAIMFEKNGPQGSIMHLEKQDVIAILQLARSCTREEEKA